MSQGRAGSPSSVATQGLPEFSAQTRLLVIAPHPDDETIAGGVLIQRVRAAGGEVGIVLLTAGDNNPWPQRWLERRLHIGADDRRRWGCRRQAEMLQALQRLGLTGTCLQSLGWPDMGLNELLLQAPATAVATLAAAIEAFCPSLVLAPALADHHPDHGAAHVLVRLALASQAEPPPLLTYLVHGARDDDHAFEVTGSIAQLASKLAALDAHGSQMALSAKRMRHLAGRPECCAWPTASLGALPWQPSAWWRPWLRLSVVGAAGAHSWRWSQAPLQRDDAGAWQLLPSASSRGAPTFARLQSSLPSPWIFDHWGWCELS